MGFTTTAGSIASRRWGDVILYAAGKLRDNGALTRETRPSAPATPEEAAADGPLRATVDSYPRPHQVLPDSKVMLVFAADDHVQTTIDKPHIRQAYDGFREGLAFGAGSIRIAPTSTR